MKPRWIAACVLGIALLAVALAIGVAARDHNASNVDEVIRMLESGEIARGSGTKFLRSTKAWVEDGAYDANDNWNGVFTLRDATRVVLLYSKSSELYAACAVEEPGRARWFFCDFDLLREHVELCRAGRTAPWATPNSGPR